jgi:hypothetical protein
MTGIPWRDLFALVSLIVGGLAALVFVGVWLFSRARRASDALQREYTTQLKDSRDELERENRGLNREVSELRGAIRVLQGMILGRCSRFVMDPTTGGCSHCDLGLAYGSRVGPIPRPEPEDVRR